MSVLKYTFGSRSTLLHISNIPLNSVACFWHWFWFLLPVFSFCKFKSPLYRFFYNLFSLCTSFVFAKFNYVFVCLSEMSVLIFPVSTFCNISSRKFSTWNIYKISTYTCFCSRIILTYMLCICMYVYIKESRKRKAELGKKSIIFINYESKSWGVSSVFSRANGDGFDSLLNTMP